MGLSGSTSDWTTGPAKWFAVIVLGTLAAAAFAWAAIGGRLDANSRVTAMPAPAEVGTAAALATGSSAREDSGGRLESGPRIEKSPHPPSAALTRKVNINTAGEAELDLLPGIGPALARRIIEYREQYGPFKTVDQLDGVKGIGPKLLGRLRELVTVEAEPRGNNGVIEHRSGTP